MKRKIVITISVIFAALIVIMLLSAAYRPEGGLSFWDKERLYAAHKKHLPDDRLSLSFRNVVPGDKPRELIVCGVVISDLLRTTTYTPYIKEKSSFPPYVPYWAIYNTRLRKVTDLAIFGVDMGREEFGDRCFKYQR
ncbi:hypothetical protein [Thalassovita sp.]|uniref:hypothetical protein n=1 Tax=Thalassovita sp. TaxID=1979401 RepID=UPI002B27709F|nr:hypothetical protein [Thalassovita sp.]